VLKASLCLGSISPTQRWKRKCDQALSKRGGKLTSRTLTGYQCDQCSVATGMGAVRGYLIPVWTHLTSSSELVQCAFKCNVTRPTQRAIPHVPPAHSDDEGGSRRRVGARLRAGAYGTRTNSPENAMLSFLDCHMRTCWSPSHSSAAAKSPSPGMGRTSRPPWSRDWLEVQEEAPFANAVMPPSVCPVTAHAASGSDQTAPSRLDQRL
jgi:hypothetical protein